MWLAIELSSIVSQPCAYNCNLLTCNWLLLPSDWACFSSLSSLSYGDSGSSCCLQFWCRHLPSLAPVVRLLMLLPLLSEILRSLSPSTNASTCSKNHIYSIPFFKLLTMHQQLAARMKNQSRSVFMFNNLDRAENLLFTALHMIFCVSVRVSYYFAFVTYLSPRKVAQCP